MGENQQNCTQTAVNRGETSELGETQQGTVCKQQTKVELVRNRMKTVSWGKISETGGQPVGNCLDKAASWGTTSGTIHKWQEPDKKKKRSDITARWEVKSCHAKMGMKRQWQMDDKECVLRCKWLEELMCCSKLKRSMSRSKGWLRKH